MASKLAKEHDKGKIGYYLNINNINIDSENNTNNEVLDKAYVSVVKKVKKDNITPENIGEIMLCQIPSISSTTALAVLQKFKTISDLIKQIELCGEECLNDILTTDANGKSRKISKACVANIIKFLLPSKKTN
jgi:ERCC4-type nuclease